MCRTSWRTAQQKQRRENWWTGIFRIEFCVSYVVFYPFFCDPYTSSYWTCCIQPWRYDARCCSFDVCICVFPFIVFRSFFHLLPILNSPKNQLVYTHTTHNTIHTEHLMLTAVIAHLKRKIKPNLICSVLFCSALIFEVVVFRTA